jgi:hypothetical protein
MPPRLTTPIRYAAGIETSRGLVIADTSRSSEAGHVLA